MECRNEFTAAGVSASPPERKSNLAGFKWQGQIFQAPSGESSDLPNLLFDGAYDKLYYYPMSARLLSGRSARIMSATHEFAERARAKRGLISSRHTLPKKVQTWATCLVT